MLLLDEDQAGVFGLCHIGVLLAGIVEYLHEEKLELFFLVIAHFSVLRVFRAKSLEAFSAV